MNGCGALSNLVQIQLFPRYRLKADPNGRKKSLELVRIVLMTGIRQSNLNVWRPQFCFLNPVIEPQIFLRYCLQDLGLLVFFSMANWAFPKIGVTG